MIFSVAKKMITTGLGMALFTKDKADEVIQDWVSEGQLSKEEGQQLLKTWYERIEAERTVIQDRIHQEVNKIINQAGLVSRDQHQILEDKVYELEQRVVSFEQGRD